MNMLGNLHQSVHEKLLQNVMLPKLSVNLAIFSLVCPIKIFTQLS